MQDVSGSTTDGFDDFNTHIHQDMPTGLHKNNLSGHKTCIRNWLSLLLLFFTFPLYTQNQLVVSSISLKGNETTRDQILSKELTFHIHDTIRRQQLAKHVEESRQNLYNLQLFNFVYINSQIKGNAVNFNISVEERWHWWPILEVRESSKSLGSIIKNQEWSLLNFTAGIVTKNFRGRNELLRLMYTDGFSQQIQAEWKNIKISRNQNHSLGFLLSYDKRDHVFYNIRENKPISLKKSREPIFEEVKFNLIHSYRLNYVNWIHFKLGLNTYQLSDTIQQINPNFLGENISEAFVPQLTTQFEHRNVNRFYYPTEGEMMTFSVKKYFGVKYEAFDLWTMKGEVKNFHDFQNDLYLANGLFGKATFGTQFPFYLKNGIGYDDDFMRGYENYIIYGQKYLYSKNTLKYKVLSRQEFSLPFIPFQKFNKLHYAVYASLFSDIGYVHDRTSKKDVMNNSLSNEPMYSFGIGFDFVTYYDNVFSIGYAYNSRNEFNFFIHLRAQLY